MSAADQLRSLGGVAPAAELRARGVGPGLLRLAVDRGEVWRPRKGWYVHPRLGRDAAAAVRVGGTLSCVSAARHHGLWTPDGDAELHVVVAPNTASTRSPHDRRARLGDADSVVLHWTSSGSQAVESPSRCIERIAACQGIEVAFAVAESAAHRGLLGVDEARRLIRSLRGGGDLACHLHGLSESGSESMLKLLFIRLRLSYRQQVDIDGVGRVDFVVGRDLIVEADSREFHADQLRDRRRDAAASARGYRTLRFLYRQILHERLAVERAILGALVRGDITPPL